MYIGAGVCLLAAAAAFMFGNPGVGSMMILFAVILLVMAHD